MTEWTFVHVADMQPGSPKSFRFEPLRNVRRSDRTPYGPGGHPKPSARDYSLAWDQSYANVLSGREQS